MLSFECDYNVGAHPKILDALLKTNFEPCRGYGNDPFTESAREANPELGEEMVARSLEYLEGAIV